MPLCKTLSALLFITGFLCHYPVHLLSQQLNLKVSGNKVTGYQVNIFDGDKLLATNPGEFDLELYNRDRSAATTITGWTGSEWTGDSESIQLSRSSYLKEFDANLTVNVSYQVVNETVVRKNIRLYQPSMPSMYYILQQEIRPAHTPLKYITFKHDRFPGGLVHEMFTSAGFITPDHQVVGLLTDAGYKNIYTRNTRRRFSGRGGGFTGLRRLPDPALLSVATPAERADHQDYIRMKFGECWNLDAGTESVIPLPTDYKSIGNAAITRNNNLIYIQSNTMGEAGLEMIAPLKDQQVYTISFLCRGDSSLSLKLFRIKDGRKTVELENGLKYIDQFPVKEKEWTLFKGSIFVPYINQDSVSLFIGTTAGKKCNLQLKNLQLIEHHPLSEPYNILPLGKVQEKTTYLFTEPWKTHRDFMISSQARLAEGKGFKGSLIEKMLYANFNMLTWVNDIDNFEPFNVPNMNYAPDMYNRDSFWSIVSTYNKKLNLSVWDQWGRTQTEKGAIGTIITPSMGSVEVKDNEATIEWLIWAMLNKRRFSASPPPDKIKKAVDYVLNEFDEDKDGICRSHFPMSQIDIIDYNPKTDRLAVNQGIFAIGLRTIQELGFPISDSYIQKAEQEYRNFYDEKRKHLLFDKKYPDIISLTDLEPEFLSLWLFNRPILTDTMVINQLEQIPLLNKVTNSPHPEYGTTAPICVRVFSDKPGFSYLDSSYQPFGEFGEQNYGNGSSDGYYYNGGSWMRPEYCAYVTGLKHGWKKARAMMDNRAWAEINLNPGWPFSKEFIPTKWESTDSWWPSTKGLCWNVFILMADEVAGLRTPDMDPDYKAAGSRQPSSSGIEHNVKPN